VIFRRAAAVPEHIAEAAAKDVETAWLQPRVWSPEAEAAALRLGVTLIKDCCIAEVHRHVTQQSGHPGKWGVHVRSVLDEKKMVTGAPSRRRGAFRPKPQ